MLIYSIQSWQRCAFWTRLFLIFKPFDAILSNQKTFQGFSLAKVVVTLLREVMSNICQKITKIEFITKKFQYKVIIKVSLLLEQKIQQFDKHVKETREITLHLAFWKTHPFVNSEKYGYFIGFLF